MDPAANPDEAAAWNGPRGQDWVRMQDELQALFTGVTALILDTAAPRPGQRVLDIGCGAGDTTLAVARHVAPGGYVLGADISRPLLDLAASRLTAADPAAFVLADAQTHPFDPGSFDLAISRFGAMFFADTIAAFRNIARALRPGARIVLAAWGPEAVNPWFTLPVEAAAARLGPIPAGPPPTIGPLGFADLDRVLGLMRAAGWAETSGRLVTLDLTPRGSLDDAAALALRLGPVSRLIAARGGTEADRAAIAADLRQRLAAFATPAGLRIPAAVNLFQARLG